MFLAAKSPLETVERRWSVPVSEGDVPSSFVLSASGVTATGEIEGNELVLTIGGGTAGSTATITAAVSTNGGFTLRDVLYIPVVAEGVTGVTVNDICTFALRSIIGNGETPEAAAMADAVERFADMVEFWRATGADVGAPSPLTTSTVLYCAPGVVQALKSNLIVALAPNYEPAFQLSPATAQAARQGLAHVRQKNLPDTRAQDYF